MNQISHHVSAKVSIFKSLKNILWLSSMNTDVIWKKMTPLKWSDTISRYDLGRVSVSLDGRVAVDFEVTFAQVSLSVTVSWHPSAFWSRYSQLHDCLHAAVLPSMRIMGWTSETVNQHLNKMFPLEQLLWSWCLSIARKIPTKTTNDSSKIIGICSSSYVVLRATNSCFLIDAVRWPAWSNWGHIFKQWRSFQVIISPVLYEKA